MLTCTLAVSLTPARATDACKVIDDLPDETLLHIFFMLPKFSDNLAVRRVSRRCG